MSVYIDQAGNIIDTSAGNNPALAGSVYNLFSPSTYGVGSYGNFGPGGGGLTAPASAAFDTFLNHAFDVIGNTGTVQFSQLNSTFNQWAGWQSAFADKVGNIFGDIAKKSAKAPSGLLGTIFGF